MLAVSFAAPSVVRDFLAEYSVPFPVLSDPERIVYRAFGLGHTSWKKIFQGGVLGRYLGLILRGWWPRRSPRGEDLMQLGGDFILDPLRRLAYAHRSAEPTDRPLIGELLKAVEAVPR